MQGCDDALVCVDGWACVVLVAVAVAVAVAVFLLSGYKGVLACKQQQKYVRGRVDRHPSMGNVCVGMCASWW